MTCKEIQIILKKETDAILNIPITDQYEKAIDLIVEHVHKKRGKLVISGMGKAGQIGQNMSTTFCSTGTSSIFLHPSEAQHGDLGVLQDNDLLLLITNSGETREIIELIELAKDMYPRIPIIVITGNESSVLAKDADVFLLTGNPKEVCPLDLTPTTSTTVMTVIGDIIVVGTMKKINFTASEYAKRHHSGYLGDKSRNSGLRVKKV